jgi:hypothetical protein
MSATINLTQAINSGRCFFIILKIGSNIEKAPEYFFPTGEKDVPNCPLITGV